MLRSSPVQYCLLFRELEDNSRAESGLVKPRTGIHPYPPFLAILERVRFALTVSCAMSNSTARFPETTGEYNRALDRALSRYPHMNLRRWKLIKSILLSLAVLVFGAFAILQGAEPTTVALPALITAALIAGVEWSELVAIWAETSQEYRDQQNDDSN